MTPRALAWTLLPALLVLGCDDRIVPTAPERETCGPYPDAATSPYRLPIPVGESTTVLQGNCTNYTHAGASRHAYDFTLEIGRTIVAVRGGTVTDLQESARDSVETALNEANFVEIVHGDGTVADYVHLMQDGVLVEVGDSVTAGQPIARAGFTGFAGSIPHLHFVVYGCESGCDSIPVTFNNADPPDPGGLEERGTYTARAPGVGTVSIDGTGSLPGGAGAPSAPRPRHRPHRERPGADKPPSR